MIIKKLHIYGYGKIVDQEFSFTNGFHVIYGENEAGKTTIMSFIHSILFGFPTRSQSENRYEPRDGMRYGGKIVVEIDRYGSIAIERVSGKAAGDVSVYFQNGTIGHEKELVELMHGMNKKLYTSIFSFGFQGLQNIQTIKTDDLSPYLFSSSILGNDQILELEKKIGREMDALFKPTGKKPEINQVLDETEALSQQVNGAKSQLIDYQNLLDAKQRNEKQLSLILAEAERLTSLEEKLHLFGQYVPLRNEVLAHRKQQHEMGGQPVFPADGMKKFEQIGSHLLPIEAKVNSLKEKYEEISEDCLKIRVDDELLNAEMEIRELLKDYASIQLAKNTSAEIKTKLEVMEEEVKQSKRKLGLTLANEEAIQIELPLSLKDEIKNLTHQFLSIRNKRDILEQQQEQLKNTIKSIESTKKKYENQLLEESEKRELEEILLEHSQSFATERDKQKAISKQSQIKKQIVEFNRRHKKVKLVRNLVLIPLAICLMLYSTWNVFISTDSISYLLSISALALFCGSFLWAKPQSQFLSLLNEEQRELQQKIEEWNLVESSFLHKSSVQEAQQLLAKDEQLFQLWQKEKVMLQQYEIEFEKCIDQFEVWEHDSADVMTKFHKLKKRMHIPAETGPEMVMDFYVELEKLLTQIHQVNKLSQEKLKLDQIIKDYSINYHKVYEKMNSTYSDTSPQGLVKLLEEEKKKQQQVSFLADKQKDIKDTMDQYNKELMYFNDQISLLFKMAHVNTEEDFRKKARLLAVWNELDVKIVNLNNQISFLLKNDEQIINEFTNDWDQLNQMYLDKVSVTNKLKSLKQSELEIVSEIAKIEIQKKQVEEKGTYSSLLQLYETSKSKLNEMGHRWARLAIAKDILLQTKEYYRQVRLPQVIEKAEYYFSILTKGNYVHLFSHEVTNDFIVERKDGQRFSPQELSQATSEQLYLSLRVALASYYHSPVKLPFIVDDGFVNFDLSRFKLTIELLKELSKERQIIFFTCHKQVIDSLIDENEVVAYLTSNGLEV